MYLFYVKCPFTLSFEFCQKMTFYKVFLKFSYREYTDSQLYSQLLFYQTLFDLNKFSDTYPDYKFKWANEWNVIQKKYQELYNLVKSQLMTNKYCMVSLNKVFEGLFPVKAERKNTF